MQAVGNALEMSQDIEPLPCLENNNPPPKQHPLLCRHFASIGIGDVFLEPPMHPLPSVYLEGGDNESVVQMQIKRPFLSREITGSVKSHPEDFVVREIALPHRCPLGRVASLDQSSCAQLQDDPNKPKQVQDEISILDALLPLSKRQKTAPKDEDTPSHKPEPDLSAQRLETDQDQLHFIQTMLSSALEQQPTQGEEKKRTSETILAEIRNLQQAFVDAIQRKATTSFLDPTETFNAKELTQGLVELWLPPLVDTKPVERGAFYRALRVLFPMLDGESVAPREIPGLAHGQESHKIKVCANTMFLDLIPYLYEPHVDLPVLYKFFRCQFGTNRSSNDPVLRLRPDLERKWRAPVHQFIANKTRKSLVTTTINSFPLHPGTDDNEQAATTTTAIVVSWSNNSKRTASRKRARAGDTSSPAAPFNSLVVIRKYMKEHSKAHGALVSALRCTRHDVAFAGKKDLKAVTYQFCTIRAHTPAQVARAALKQIPGVMIGPAVKVDWSLNAGDLSGNRFELVVRNLQRISVIPTSSESCMMEEIVACDEDHVHNCVQRLKQRGFINFFGEQRVGRAGDKSIVGVRPFEVGRALLLEKHSEVIDLIMAGRELTGGCDFQEEEDLRIARRSWIEQGRNPEITSKLLPKTTYVSKERALLTGLKRYGGDLKKAVEMIPGEERRFYVSCYQSYVWNLAATERVRIFGGLRAVPGDLILPTGGDIPRVLKEDDDKDADIRFVVLPLVGTDSVLPENELGVYLKNLLNVDGVDFRQPNKHAMKGSYRYLIAPACNIMHRISRDNDDGDRSKKNLHIQFDLPSGSFATSLLRELMYTTVSREKEYSLSEYE